jgi:hypothetical protein
MTTPDNLLDSRGTARPGAMSGKSTQSKTKRQALNLPERVIAGKIETADGPEKSTDILLAGEEIAFTGGDNSQVDAHRQRIQECAYYLWKTAGEPEGNDLEFWQQAQDRLANEADLAARELELIAGMSDD